MKLELQMPMFLRQYLTYGTGVLFHGWEEREEPQRFWERQLQDAPLDTEAEERRFREEEEPQDEMEFEQAGTVVRLVEKLVKVKCGPTARVVDLFHFFVAPSTAPSIADATLAFEDLEVPVAHLEEMHDKYLDPAYPSYGRFYDHPEWASMLDLKGALPTERLHTLRERWNRIGLDVNPDSAFPKGLDKKGHVQLTPSYWRGTIPSARDEQGKLYGKRDWLITWVNGLYPVRIQPNPSYRQIRPWVEGRLFRTTNLFYAQGMLDAVASLQYFLNDVGNLTLDNLMMALNPVVTVDETLVTNMESLRWAPGAKWFVAKEGVNVLNLPTQAQLGMATLNMMQGFIHDFSQTNAAVQGAPPARGRGRVAQTASGYSQLLATGSQAMQLAIKDLEQQLTVPLLERNYELASQFWVEKRVLQVLGAQGAGLITEEVGFEDIFGEYTYEWRGSVGLRERMALLTTLQNLPQLVAQAPPQVQQAFQWVEFFKLMLTDGANVTWADRIFKTGDELPSIDPKLEADVMAAHRRVDVHPADQNHLPVHLQSLATDERFQRDPIARQLLMEHLQQTQAQEQQRQQQMMMQAVQQIMGQMQGPQGPQQRGPGGPNQQGSMPSPQGGPMGSNGGGPGDEATAMADMFRGMA
jgi:ribosomal protein S18 acetylase RimI-like enzyme